MSKFLGLPPLPPALKSLTPFLQRAEEVKSQDEIIAYWCVFYAAQLGISCKVQDVASRSVLFDILSVLEKMKEDIGSIDVMTDEAASSAYVENFALKVFAVADNEDRREGWTKLTAKRFLAAANFLEVLRVFSKFDTSESNEEKIRYAKWKAADIAKALREGRKPTPGPANSGSEPLPSSTPPNTELEPVPSPPLPPASPIPPPSPPKQISQIVPPPPQADITFDDPGVENPTAADPHVTHPYPGLHNDGSEMSENWNVTVVSSTPDEAVHGQEVEGPVEHGIRPSIGSPSSPIFPIIPSAPPLPPQPPVMPPQVPVYFIRPPSPPAQERDIETELTPAVIAKAQKHARFAISALDYEDVEQSRKELRTALAILGGR